MGIHLGKEQGAVEEGASKDDAEMCVKACAGVFYHSEPYQDTNHTVIPTGKADGKESFMNQWQENAY